MRIRFSFLILIFFAASLHVRPLPLQAQENVAGDTATSGSRRWYPRYVTFLPPSQVDSVLHYSRTDLVPVVYEVNKYTLHPTAQTDSIARLVKRIRDDYRVRLAYVWVGGSASPEGPVEWNLRLGDYRSRALAGYLQEHALLPDSLLRVENLAEDWESVACALRDEGAFPHREDILRILATEPDYAARKQQIQALDGGRTWTRLVRRVFPPFRNSRMVIVCYDQPPVPPVVRYRAPGVSTLPGKLSYAGPVAQEGPSAGRAVLLKSNVLAIAAAAVANVGFEVELWPRWSLDVPVYYSPYDLFKETRKVRLLATQPEVRYWFSRVADRHFVGLHTHVAGFNIALGDKGRYQDPGHALWGMGVSYGYALPFGKCGRWGAEFTLGVGFADYKYDKYENTGIRTGQKVYASGDKLTILAALAACALGLAGCEATIHQYPAEEQTVEDFVVRLHADRTPPPFYKEIAYDPDGRRTETELEAEASPAYLPDDRLALRFVVEVRDNTLGGDEAVVARRELTVDNDALPPQAEVHFRLPAGGDYTAVAWADYVPAANPADWHYDTSRLDFIEVNTETVMQELHHKNSATGLARFGMTRQTAGAADAVVYMTRPAGRLRLYTDDLDEFLKAGGNIEEVQVVIRYKQFVSVAYDALGQEPCRWVSTRETRTHPSIVNGTGNVCLAYDYILVDSDGETHVMADFYFLDAEGNELSRTANVDIPLRRNRETVIRSRFLTRNLGDGGLGVDEGFDDEYVIVVGSSR